MNQKEIENLENLEKLVSQKYNNIAGLMVLKDGETMYENYFNDCEESSKLHVYSVSKSIVSILLGIAIDKGYIKGLDQKVIEFFPDYEIKKREKTIQNITLKDLITMTAPYKYKRVTPYIKYFTSDDFVKFSLDLLGGKDQIGDFRYTPLIGPDILTGILTNVTGQSVLEFARVNLFTPLGISVDEAITFSSKKEQMVFNKATNISGWVTDSIGVNTGGWGLTLSTSDMAKIGQLYLNKGNWEGKQLVSRFWIEEASRVHSVWQEQKLQYGYLWWIVNSTHQSCAAMGDGGNVIYVNPHNNIVIAISSLFKPRVIDRIEFIKEHVEPIFVGE